MNYITESNPPGNTGQQQLDLFTSGDVLCELAVDALQGDREAIRGAAKDLLTLVRYHATRTPGPVQS